MSAAVEANADVAVETFSERAGAGKQIATIIASGKLPRDARDGDGASAHSQRDFGWTGLIRFHLIGTIGTIWESNCYFLDIVFL